MARSGEGVERLRARFASHALLDVVACDLEDLLCVSKTLDGIRSVIHLAAQKHVDRSERDPSGAVRSNVLGTLNLLTAARTTGVRRVVVASSDKAAEPAGVLGATKFLVERIACASEAPVCTAVRLGGLLESTGSVLQRWRQTARDRGRIEIRDPSMTRFLMETDEAISSLTSVTAQDGQKIVATVLRAYRLGDLAEAFLSAVDADLIEVGMRPGERRHESLVSAAEAPFTSRVGNHFVISPGALQGGVPPYSSDTATRLDVNALKRLIVPERAVA